MCSPAFSFFSATSERFHMDHAVFADSPPFMRARLASTCPLPSGCSRRITNQGTFELDLQSEYFMLASTLRDRFSCDDKTSLVSCSSLLPKRILVLDHNGRRFRLQYSSYFSFSSFGRRRTLDPRLLTDKKTAYKFDVCTCLCLTALLWWLKACQKNCLTRNKTCFLNLGIEQFFRSDDNCEKVFRSNLSSQPHSTQMMVKQRCRICSGKWSYHRRDLKIWYFIPFFVCTIIMFLLTETGKFMHFYDPLLSSSVLSFVL